MVTNLDELNVLPPDRSLSELTESSYYDFFMKMDLPSKEIAKRIETAEAFEDAFLVILSYALILYQRGAFDKQVIQQRFRESYLEVVQRRISDESWYLTNRAMEFSEGVADATEKHIDSEYYTSLERAMQMSRTESNVVNNYAYFQEMSEQGYTKKQWKTMLDGKVRDSHKPLEGKAIGIYEYFSVNGYSMMFPADTTFSPPASEIAGCRCSLNFIK